jgi:PAS domain S-box-containing protein
MPVTNTFAVSSGVAQSAEPATGRSRAIAISSGYLIPFATVFLAYLVAGRLGQATSNIRSSNLGPVWPAYGIALASLLAYGHRVWPAVAVSAIVVAMAGAVSLPTAIGQAAGATLAAMTGTYLLRRIPNFHPSLSRLRDALGLIVLGAFGSALVSSIIGVGSLYATGVQAYSGLPSAWLIYWLGDATGVLLVTPLVFTMPALIHTAVHTRRLELLSLLALLTAACFVVFGDVQTPVHMHVLAFAILPFVMWGAINFGIGGAALTVIWIASIATVLTALGRGPFAGNTTFVNAMMLDVLFTVLSVSGLSLAAVIAERERLGPRLQLAAIVESSDDAIWSEDLDGVILSWNAAAQRIFGLTAADAIGGRAAVLQPPGQEKENEVLPRLMAGGRTVHRETVRMAKDGSRIRVSLTASPLWDASGNLSGISNIARDITEQQRAREALQAVSRKLIDAQEQERARIARELHDDIGQRLALLVADLSDGSSVHPAAERLCSAAAGIAVDIQNLSHNLHSSKLQYLGLAQAFTLFCDEFSNQHKVSVVFEARDVPSDVSETASLSLYRVLQEALRNAEKHSGRRTFDVRLRGSNGTLELLIRDEGIGFDVEAARATRGIGLVTMEERITLAGGSLEVRSVPHQGTTIRAQVPVDRVT